MRKKISRQELDANLNLHLHSHNNETVLNKLSENEGKLMFDGKAIETEIDLTPFATTEALNEFMVYANQNFANKNDVIEVSRKADSIKEGIEALKLVCK